MDTDPGASYAIGRQIGKGSFGEVFLVTHKESGASFVLKRIRLAKQSDWQRSSSMQERDLVRAAGACCRLPPHGSITALQAAGMAQNAMRTAALARTSERWVCMHMGGKVKHSTCNDVRIAPICMALASAAHPSPYTLAPCMQMCTLEHPFIVPHIESWCALWPAAWSRS